MLLLSGLRYLVSAEILALAFAAHSWWRVWKFHTLEDLRIAAFSSAVLVGLRAIALSVAILVTTR
jgi:hypothetical protein